MQNNGTQDNRMNIMKAFALLAAVAVVSLVYAASHRYYIYLNVYIWFGLAYGMMLQYGRFCFASASRDLFATGVPRMAVGILIALAFFGIIQAVLKWLDMSTFHPAPFGIHTLIAGVIFGIGMTLAGGCASGSLYKIGEGNGAAIVSIMGISFGQAFFVITGGPLLSLIPRNWKVVALNRPDFPTEKIHSWFDYYLTGYIFELKSFQLSDLPFFAGLSGVWKYLIADTMINVFLPATILMVLLYTGYMKKGFLKKRKKKGLPTTGIGVHLTGIWGMITSSSRTSVMGVLIGITAGLHIFVMKGMQNKFNIENFGQLLTRMGHQQDVGALGGVFDPGYWYITTQEAQFAGWIMEKLGINMRDNIFYGVVNGLPALWRNPALWMSIGIILGAMILALANREFKFKMPRGEMLVWPLIGGLLMGIGSRPALGCNIGAFFIRAAGGDPGGWIFGAGMVLGALAGVRFFNWWTERKMALEFGEL